MSSVVDIWGRLQGGAETGSVVVHHASPAAVAQEAAGHLHAVTGCDLVAVGVVEDPPVLVLRGVAGARTPQLRNLTILPGQGLAGLVLRDNKIIEANCHHDYEDGYYSCDHDDGYDQDHDDGYYSCDSCSHDDHDFLTDSGLGGQLKRIAAAEDINAMVGMPVSHHGQVIGVLVGACRRSGPPGGQCTTDRTTDGPHERRRTFRWAVRHCLLPFAEALSERLARSLRQTRTIRAQRDCQREPVADRLLEEVGRRLSLVKAAAVQLENSATAEIASLGVLLAQDSQRAQHGLNNILGVACRQERHERIEQAINGLVNDLGRRSGLDTRFVIEGQPRQLRFEVQAAIIGSVREAHVNIEAHAQATRVETGLVFGPDTVMLFVGDNGLGSSVRNVSSIPTGCHCWGLASVQTRIERLGGQFWINTDATGTLIRALIPTKAVL